MQIGVVICAHACRPVEVQYAEGVSLALAELLFGVYYGMVFTCAVCACITSGPTGILRQYDCSSICGWRQRQRGYYLGQVLGNFGGYPNCAWWYLRGTGIAKGTVQTTSGQIRVLYVHM